MLAALDRDMAATGPVGNSSLQEAPLQWSKPDCSGRQYMMHMLFPCPQVRVVALTTKRVEHSGIRVQLLGQIELASERGHYHDFVSLGELD
jgi:hypothetical protein